MAIHISLDHEVRADFARRHHIVRIAVFGSALGDDFRDVSDVDVLVRFAPGNSPGWQFFSMQAE